MNLTDRSGNRTQDFIYDGNVAGSIGGAYDPVHFYMQDELGSPVRVTKDSEEYIPDEERYLTYGYDEYGNGLYEDTDEAFIQPFGYTGYRYDETVGTYFAQAREYRPEDGRFGGVDWIKGNIVELITQNEYVYCRCNSLIYVDYAGNEAYSYYPIDNGLRIVYNPDSPLLRDQESKEWYIIKSPYTNETTVIGPHKLSQQYIIESPSEINGEAIIAQKYEINPFNSETNLHKYSNGILDGSAETGIGFMIEGVEIGGGIKYYFNNEGYEGVSGKIKYGIGEVKLEYGKEQYGEYVFSPEISLFGVKIDKNGLSLSHNYKLLAFSLEQNNQKHWVISAGGDVYFFTGCGGKIEFNLTQAKWKIKDLIYEFFENEKKDYE